MNLTERTTAALAWIEAQITICDTATKGAWRVDGISSAMVWSTDIRPTLISTGSMDEDAALIAAARTGYPAMLEGMKVAIEFMTEPAASWNRNNAGSTFQEEAFNALEQILTKIENLK